MVGRTLKSKINGNLFFVEKLYTEDGRQYYDIRDLAGGGLYYCGKEWFEKGLMQNLEIVNAE